MFYQSTLYRIVKQIIKVKLSGLWPLVGPFPPDRSSAVAYSKVSLFIARQGESRAWYSTNTYRSLPHTRCILQGSSSPPLATFGARFIWITLRSKCSGTDSTFFYGDLSKLHDVNLQIEADTSNDWKPERYFGEENSPAWGCVRFSEVCLARSVWCVMCVLGWAGLSYRMEAGPNHDSPRTDCLETKVNLQMKLVHWMTQLFPTWFWLINLGSITQIESVPAFRCITSLSLMFLTALPTNCFC